MKALLAELSKGLKEGEDPLFYDWTDDEAPAPAREAQVYVAGVALKPMQQKTMDLEKVRVGRHDPSRRAITTRIPSRGAAGAPPPSAPDPSQSPPKTDQAAIDRADLPSSHNLTIPVTISSCEGDPTHNHKERIDAAPVGPSLRWLVFALVAAILGAVGLVLLLIMRQNPTPMPNRAVAKAPTVVESTSPPPTAVSVPPQLDTAFSSKPDAGPARKRVPRALPTNSATTVPSRSKPSAKPPTSSDAIERVPVF